MTTKQATRNGSDTAEATETVKLAEALAHEAEIAAEAAQIRQNARDLTKNGELTPELFMQLLPLLRKPIPEGFIVSTPAVKGKPYESTGIKSLQVQVNRVDSVLTPLWWGWETTYSDDGTLAHVTVWVGSKQSPLVERQARGGVNQASTTGNKFKGSETNAAKLAIARLGAGWEVYVGATDLDPDVDPELAGLQAQGDDLPPIDTIDGETLADLVASYEKAKAKASDGEQFARDFKLELGAMGVPTPSLKRAFASLTPAQATDVEKWLASRVQS